MVIRLNNLLNKTLVLFPIALITALSFLGIFISNSKIASANVEVNAGIASGVWFSEFPFFDGQEVSVKTAFQNNSGETIFGTATFYEENSEIGTLEFNVATGKLIELSHKFTASYGDKTFSVSIDTEGDVVSQTARSYEIFIDLDTDGDGVGNEEDLDDDGDGINDSEDSEPLVYNKPDSGVGSLIERFNSSNTNKSTSSPQTLSQVQESTKNFFSSLNNFTDKINERIEDKISEVQEELEEIEKAERADETEELIVVEGLAKSNSTSTNVSGENSIAGKNTKYLQLALLSASAVLFGNKWLFYTGVVIILFFTIRFIIRKFKRRFD
jgi:hypothetical protein